MKEWGFLFSDSAVQFMISLYTVKESHSIHAVRLCDICLLINYAILRIIDQRVFCQTNDVCFHAHPAGPLHSWDDHFISTSQSHNNVDVG